MTDRFPEPTIAKDFLKRKVNVSTDRWDELKWGEHAHAFTVAHSIEADVLDTIHGLLNKAMAGGEAYDTFKKGMLEMMRKEGWYGGAGHKENEKRYINWRARVIYDTNMKSVYAAEHYRKQLQIADMRPIWVYHSQLVGANRRQEHIALHEKAFRYDDPFWDSYYPPNGFGCECYVTSESEYGAERDGREVLKSDSDGNPPEIDGVDWDKFGDPAWKYNVGREALAPNFGKYENLKKIKMDDGQGALNHVLTKYQESMNNTRLTQGEFKTFLNRMDKKEMYVQDINFQVGNLDIPQYQAMQNEGLLDSKIMCTQRQLGHGSGGKNQKQKIPEGYYSELYQVLQSPEHIYEDTKPDNTIHGREFHFCGNKGKDGKIINVVLRQLTGCALQLITMGRIEYDHTTNKKYKKIW